MLSHWGKIALRAVLVLTFLFGSAGREANGQGSPAAEGERVSGLDESIWVVFQARNDVYWFGSDGHGVYRYDGKTIVRYTTKDGLRDDRVREIKEDASGNLFIGTLDGISKFDGKTFITLTPVESEGLKGWRLDPNDLWFKGDSMGKGPYRYDGKTLYQLRFPKSKLEEGFYRDNPKSVASPYGVYTIYQGRGGSLWFGTAGLGLCRYDGKSFGWMYERGLTETPEGGSFGIRSIMEDSRGMFWICNTAQRYVISPERGEVLYQKERGVEHTGGPAGGGPVYFNAITSDQRGQLWMATYGSGVWRYDGERLSHFPVKDGGKDVLSVSISKDNQGTLWIGSQGSGVYRFDGEAFKPFRP